MTTSYPRSHRRRRRRIRLMRLRWALHRRVMAVAVAVATGAVVLCGVTATAYFVSSGSGTSSASIGTLKTVTVAAVAGGDAPSSALLPGGPAADVILRVDNPNSFSVILISVTGNGAITPDGSHPSCTTTGVTFTAQAGLGITVPAGSSLINLPGAAAMDATSSNGCQGATFAIPVSITVHQ